MISLLQLSKLTRLLFFSTILFFFTFFSNAEDEPIDIWKKETSDKVQGTQTKTEEKKITIESPILSSDIEKITIDISEHELDKSSQKIVGLFDPEKNNFNLNMWLVSDGNDIKVIFKRLNKLKLSKFSEDLLFQVLFTNAYPPKINLTSDEFIKMKVNWLIKNRRFNDLENLLQLNPQVGKEVGAVKSLVNEYLSSGDIKSACEKANLISKEIQNNYLDKLIIYCLVREDRKNEAQIILDLLKERGFKDNFFEDKINFLLGMKEKTNQNILDDNLLNFYFSHITSDKFEYQPDEKTDKHIWRYLSSANLIQVNNIENEEIISTYEQAAAENSFESEEIFNIYKQILFNVNQLINVDEIYKDFPNYKSRALVYQSILLSDNVEKKLYLAFLLKDLFIKDKLFKVYSEELINILKSIDPKNIPDVYVDLVEQHLEKNFETAKKIKFDNDVLHKSKVLRHFIDDNEKISRTEKDFKNVYKKIKRNKKYFISIKDIIMLESLEFDGLILPKDLNYSEISSQLTVPKNLEKLVLENQLGLVMLKIIEIIGEDNIADLDPETIYFLNRIMNKLNLKKIRNNILITSLPARV